MKIPETAGLYKTHFGRLYRITGIYDSVHDANQHCTDYDTDGVLTQSKGLIYLAPLKDKGVNHGFINLGKTIN